MARTASLARLSVSHLKPRSAPGTAAFAISKGTVEFIADSGNAGYGRQLCLAFSFQGRKHFASYAHLQEVKVKQRQEVAEGYTIALTGRSGNAANLPASQWHLHFQIRTIAQIPGGQGLFGRIDPGIVLGYQVLSCH